MIKTINDKTVQMWGDHTKYSKVDNDFILQWASENYDNYNYKDNEFVKIKHDGKELEFEVKKNKKSINIYIGD
jgi:hypothetical protein